MVCCYMALFKRLSFSDGNAKDSIRVTPNMKFDFKDTSAPPSLEEFKLKLIRHLFKTAFWQNEPPIELNMLKLPIIMPPAIIGNQVNNDNMKDSLLDKSVKHSNETLREFVKMVDNKGKTYGLIALEF